MKEQLIQIGFGDKEAEIYLALIKLEKANIAELMKKTSVERRTIYDVLERLIQKGWASYFEENGKKYYLPVKPELILEDFEQKKKEFEKIIPTLNSLKERQKSSLTKVELYRGVKGLKTIGLEIIKSKSIHYSFGDISPMMLNKIYAPMLNNFLEILEERKIKEKVIYAKGDSIKKIKGGQYKAISKELIPPTPTTIYDDITVQYIYTDPLTIIKITSPEIAKTNKKYFDIFWNMK